MKLFLTLAFAPVFAVKAESFMEENYGDLAQCIEHLITLKHTSKEKVPQKSNAGASLIDQKTIVYLFLTCQALEKQNSKATL